MIKREKIELPLSAQRKAKDGFTLPFSADKHATLTFSGNKVVSLATSPMLEALPFDEVVALLQNLSDFPRLHRYGAPARC